MPLFRKFSVFFVCTGCFLPSRLGGSEDVERLPFGRGAGSCPQSGQ